MVSLHKNNNNNKGRQLLFVLRLYISVKLQQKTANFKVASYSRPMQWSTLTEGNSESKRMNLPHENDENDGAEGGGGGGGGK